MKTGLPTFYELLAEFVEELRSTHPHVESYSIPKIFYLVGLQDKIKTRSYVDEHLLVNLMNNVINSSEKDSTANQITYKKLIKDYYNGRRNS